MKKLALAALAVCTLAVAACTTEDFIRMVQSAPEKAAKMVVERGNLYCQLPKDVRMDFRKQVAAAAEADGGYFIKEEITCEGD